MVPPPPPFGTHFVARLGDRVEGPDFLARLRVVGGDLAAHPVLGAGDADVDLAVVGGRGHRLVGAGGGVFDLRGPEALAGLLADRLQLVVEGEEEELAVFGGDPAVDGDPVAADPGRLREVDFRRVGPVDVAGFAVDRHHLVGRGGDVDVFAEHQREATPSGTGRGRARCSTLRPVRRRCRCRLRPGWRSGCCRGRGRRAASLRFPVPRRRSGCCRRGRAATEEPPDDEPPPPQAARTTAAASTARPSSRIFSFLAPLITGSACSSSG